METEYTGARYRAALLEAMQLPVSTVLFRLQWEAGKRVGLHKGRYEPSKLTNDDVLGLFPLTERSPAGLLEYFRTRPTVKFYFDRDELPAIRRIWRETLPDARDRLIGEADRICRHEFCFLGCQRTRFEGDINWHAVLDGKNEWPRQHWSAIDIRSDARLGDVKWTWELNRTQFFVTLARAYVLTQDERYVRELHEQMRSWIEQNPSEMGVNWYSNLECALRAASWMFALEMTLDWNGWEAGLFADIIRSLIDHHHHLVKDIVYSEYCIPNNHLVGDAMGIALLSLYLPELEHAAKYKKKALRVLFREGPVQILPDGVSFENAISYHRFVFYMYLLVGLLLDKNGQSMPPVLWKRLEDMCEFAMHMRTPTKQLCQIGDWDDGEAILLDDSDVGDIASMLCTGAVRFKRADLKAAAGEFREEALWLLGSKAAERFDGLESERSSPADKPYYSGGYCFWRSDWTDQAEFALFKCAPFTSHTHADNLTVLYSAGGKDWLVDRGTFTYNGDWPWRTYFRGTRAHNAVTVDGFGQALAHRAFRWLKEPKQQLHKYHADDRFGYAAGSTTGFRHLASPVRHARSILLVRGRYLLVLDSLFGKDRHQYELSWHIAPEHRVEITDQGAAHTVDLDGANLWMHAVGSSKLTVRLARGETDPIQGWHSRGYGHKEPAPSVLYATGASGPIHLVTLLTTVGPGSGDPKPAVRFDEDSPAWGDRVLVKVSGPGFDDRVCLPNPDELLSGHLPADLADMLWIERADERIPIL